MPTPKEVSEILRAEMNARGWHNNDQRAGLAAIVGGESQFQPKFETGYAHTSNARIRQIFNSRLGGMGDGDLNVLKASDERFFNHIYGPSFQGIHHLGNEHATDGYAYRGGGLIQLTGRANYRRYGNMVNVDLENHPELINVPRVAAAVAVEYMKDRYHGGDFDAMKRAVGLSLGAPNDEKNRLYLLYSATREWRYVEPVTPDAGEGGDTAEPVERPTYDPVVWNFLNSLEALQKFLKAKRLYSGPIDHDPGPSTRLALKAYFKVMK